MEDSFGIQQLMDRYSFEKGRGYEHHAPGHDDWQEDQENSDQSEYDLEFIQSQGGEHIPFYTHITQNIQSTTTTPTLQTPSMPPITHHLPN